MKIALLSSYGIRCGLADYCTDLARAWQAQGHDIRVFSELTVDNDDPRDLPPPERHFLRTMYSAKSVAEPILEWGPDFVSIEHEFGVWPNDGEFIAALSLLQDYAETIVTLHTVPRWPFHRRFFGLLDGNVVVHHPGALVAMLAWRGFNCWPDYLPHGLSPWSPCETDREYAPVPTALMPGFISASKGHFEILSAMGHVEGWNLEIVGEAVGGDYLDLLLARVSYLGLTDRVKIVPQFQDRQALRTRMSTAAVVLLNTVSDNFSASGQAADAISSGAMTVSRTAPIYDALNGLGFKFGFQIGTTLPPPDELGRAVLTAAASLHTEEQVETMKAMCQWRSWDRMAKERLKIVGLA